MCSLFNNLPSNVRKVLPKSLEGQKGLYIDKLAPFNGMIMRPPTQFSKSMHIFAIYFMENAIFSGPHHCLHIPSISNLLSPA